MKWRNIQIGLIGLLVILMIKSKGTEPGVVQFKTENRTVGENVTLDCHNENLQEKIKSVEWKFNDEHYALVYKSGNFSPADQCKRFKGSASAGDSWDLRSWNLPLKISGLQKSDAGTYSCIVVMGEPKKICSTKLYVNDRETQVQPRTTSSHSSSTIGVVLTLMLAMSTLLLTFSRIIMYERRGKNGTSTQRANQRDAFYFT
ncbi:uncharacterized protein LOC134876224 isoform X2 [Eleginops maclovinus]|uniref:uncharacterized protein LOC134876224 isoform X2 n=1 Tax=Eleginops maclovinus TaxID=56733 RepID=UPI003080AF25